MLLGIGDGLTGVCFVPTPIQIFGDLPELDEKVVRQIFRFGFTALFPPQPQQRSFIFAHNDAGVRAADERASCGGPLGKVGHSFLDHV